MFIIQAAYAVLNFIECANYSLINTFSCSLWTSLTPARESCKQQQAAAVLLLSTDTWMQIPRDATQYDYTKMPITDRIA